MRVRIYAYSKIIAEGLSLVVQGLGFEVSSEQEPPADVALWHIRASPPYPALSPVPTLAICATTRDEMINLIHHGFRGYLVPEDDGQTLKQALEAIGRGEIWAGREVLTRALDGFIKTKPTSREKEILSLLVKGCSNGAIAKALGIAERTVKSHISHLFEKYGVDSRMELVLSVMERQGN